ncbi:xanthotoxin 5-hydroxylase CYP82C4 isoform X1 [Ziziphus jujuba]|uniref:Xanthotoxin 5-hydroxylase CYP82C4 isoform X1 n=1 Tax=Ziziphus jujuba TaxID=326968 RepID=A0A6P4B1U9_ZIZJJ|nr:xanthotoxin 5-hydroxylase CYP82C4 isoform X1 [Ziziphus jujuba]
MEMSSHLQAIGSLFAFLLLYKIWISIRSHHDKSKENKLPEPKGWWPLIGHLHLLRGDVPAFRTLAAIADKNGPIFRIQLGTKQAIVVSSWETVKECFSPANDKVFLTRPASAASRYLGYGNAFFGLTTDVKYWRHIRRIANVQVLSNRRLQLLKDARASEVEACIKHLHSVCCESNNVVDIGRWFSTVVLNIIVRMVASKRYSNDEKDEESKRFIQAIHEFMHLSGVLVVSDVIPGIEWLDLLGHIASMKCIAKELDEIISSWLEEHLQNRKDEGRDFLDEMVSSMADDDASIYGYKTQNVIKATALYCSTASATNCVMQNLIIASTDSTYLTLVWALSLLLNHIQVLKTVQEELDIHVGKERWVEEADLKNLVYLQAIVKETLRLYPPGPLSVPHESMEDCYVSGYHIPKGTRLLVNIWKLHRDPRVWKSDNPEEFKPERFLSVHADLDVRGQKNFEYIPFGSGRRSCPGISSAMQMVPLILGRLLQGFNIHTPMNEPVDMTEGQGLTMAKAKPLLVMLNPRLSNVLY